MSLKIVADLHTHTVASGHAMGTMQEMITSANRLGHQGIAITDHGSAMPGAPYRWFFDKMMQLPDIIDDLLVLKGMEVNVINSNGGFDMDDYYLENLDWIIVSMHTPLIDNLSVDEVNHIWQTVAENPYVDMIGHSEQQTFLYDYDKLTKVFTKHNKVVEFNAGSALSRPGNEDNLKNLALACKKNNTYVAVTTDAHSIYEMDREHTVLAMLQEIDFPESLIINSSMQRLTDYLVLRKKAIVERNKEFFQKYL